VSSPAERYAAARQRGGQRTALAEFAAGYPFAFDAYQERACVALAEGRGVLLAAPTGAGKTVVGEFAVHLALRSGTKCFYTTPIKALSNQKYTDLVARHGVKSVGLLTGDNSINGDAAVVVMTTEVLRNMLYLGSPALRGLRYVVMDEVHYLADRFRGAVWEEVIIHLPAEVRLVSLSATVSNAEEFADWLVTVRGETTVVVEEHRPVPLWQSILVGTRLYDLFSDDEQTEVNPQLVRLAQEQTRLSRFPPERRPPRGGVRPHSRFRVASRPDVVSRLDTAGLLPSITFIFSRDGCDAAVHQCVRAGLRLNTAEEAAAARARVAERTESIPEEDLAVLGYWEWLDGLERGIAAHHAGMLPTFKEVVEELFAAGLVKVVFATETLALGINMPARSVVLERLSKWNGEAHVDLSPGEYTQLTGRAGRRGIDVEGHAVVLWTPGFDPQHVAGLASTRTYPLRSSFRPSYNMAVNLVGSFGRDRARTLLESSFAQFQADRAVVGLARQVARNEATLADYAAAMACDRGDAPEYMALRRQLTDSERARARARAASQRVAATAALERLRPGDVIRVPAGRRAGLAIVLDPGTELPDSPRPTVLTESRQVRRLAATDFPIPVEPLGRVRIPRGFNPRSPQARRDLAATLRAADLRAAGRSRRPQAEPDADLAALRRALRAHPVHACTDRDEHVRRFERWERLSRETDALRRRVDGRTNTIARTFDRVCQVLTDNGYLAGDRVTAAGDRLARLYNEADLLVAECLRAGIWDGLTVPELAAVASAVVYEPRRDDLGRTPKAPRGAVRSALADMTWLWARLADTERERGLSFLREPDHGFVWPAYRWARGDSLTDVLVDADMAAGDFVRWVRQLVDLLDQVADVAAGAPVGPHARAAVQALRRGVVAYSSVG
jgi:ATP-dependent RNA helicase HelY